MGDRETKGNIVSIGIWLGNVNYVMLGNKDDFPLNVR